MLITARTRLRSLGGQRLDVLTAAAEPLLLATEEDEAEVVGGPVANEDPGHLKQGRSPAAVVVGTRSRGRRSAVDVHGVEVRADDDQPARLAPLAGSVGDQVQAHRRLHRDRHGLHAKTEPLELAAHPARRRLEIGTQRVPRREVR